MCRAASANRWRCATCLRGTPRSWPASPYRLPDPGHERVRLRRPASGRAVVHLHAAAGTARPSFQAGRVIVRPASYSQIAAAFMHDPPVDLAVLQVTPPDGEGLCSFGPCSDFAPLVWPRARRRLAFVNAEPAARGAGPDHPVLGDRRGRSRSMGPTSPPKRPSRGRAADHRDAAGGPDSRWRGDPDRHRRSAGGGARPDHRPAGSGHPLGHGDAGLPGAGRGRRAGAGDGPSHHRPGPWPGRLHAWATASLRVRRRHVTHGAASLLGTEKLFAINSALEVDLFGQANVEWRGGRLVSGLGGAPDFARAARRSPGGRAILALPATAARGDLSRIVARLQVPTVSIPRDDTDLVVTEYGVADLRGGTLDGRAEALIAIAAPEHRARLAAEWSQIRRSL